VLLPPCKSTFVGEIFGGETLPPPFPSDRFFFFSRAEPFLLVPT